MPPGKGETASAGGPRTGGEALPLRHPARGPHCGAVEVQPVLIKLDPAQRETGAAVVRDDGRSGIMRSRSSSSSIGAAPSATSLKARSAFRRRRRSQNFRCRSPRFLNRVKPKGVAPAFSAAPRGNDPFVREEDVPVPAGKRHRDGVGEVRFAKLQNPEVSGVKYQQGTLFEYEVREYLLGSSAGSASIAAPKACRSTSTMWFPRQGGSNRVSNLVLACVSCNQKKGARSLEDFLKGKPEVLARVRRSSRRRLRDAAAVNATRWVLFNEAQGDGSTRRDGKRRSDEAQPPCFSAWKGALARCALRGTAQRRSDAEGTQRPGDQMHGAGELSTHAPHEVRLPARCT